METVRGEYFPGILSAIILTPENSRTSRVSKFLGKDLYVDITFF